VMARKSHPNKERSKQQLPMPSQRIGGTSHPINQLIVGGGSTVKKLAESVANYRSGQRLRKRHVTLTKLDSEYQNALIEPKSSQILQL